MKKKWRHWVFCACSRRAARWPRRLPSDVRFFQILNLKAYDAHFVVRDYFGQRPAISNIVLLLADQKTLDTFPELRIFWHKHYANAIRAAGQAGAKVIGLDLAFGIPVEKYEPDYDRLLGEAVSTSPVPVVCAYATEIEYQSGSATDPHQHACRRRWVWPGFANLTADSDDFVRRQELIEAPPRSPERSAARPLARPARRRKVRGKRRRVAKRPTDFAGPHDPHRGGPDHRHQLCRAAGTVPERLAGRFRRSGESGKHGPAPEMGERQDRAGGSDDLGRPSRHAVLSRSSAERNG